MSATPPELPGVRRKRILFWALGFCVVAVVGLLARGCVDDDRRYEARLQLQQAKNIAEVEQVLGKPMQTWRKYDHINLHYSRDVFTPEDEAAGLVLQQYMLWGEVLTFHPGYLTLVVKVRPTDGAVLAAKVVHE